jgi:hypothetical protein
MKKTAILILLIIFVCLLPQTILAASATRTLEIVYPKIPGVATPQYVSTGLPDYVNYIFRFAVIVIGILIFGILVYSGINYLLSFGNPSKLSDARQGMIAAGFGGLILLGSYIIFNTINPQLLILNPPEIGGIKAVITPGAYICNYSVQDIGDILIRYMGDNNDLRTEAAKRLQDAIGKPGSDKNCFLTTYSGILTNLVIPANSTDWTVFIIPSEKYNDETGTYGWEFSSGVVLHENDKFGGRCRVFPSISGTTLYRQVDSDDFHPKLGFDAKSITVFQKPTVEPDPQYIGLSLYEGPAFNEIGKQPVCGDGNCEGDEDYIHCPEDCPPPAPVGLKPEFLSSLFLPSFVLAEIDVNLKKMEGIKPAIGNDVREVTDSELSGWGLRENIRSIKIEPKDSYFTILLGDGQDATKSFNNAKCEVRRTDDANLTDDPIGRCGQCSIWSYVNPINWFKTTGCDPCVESLYVIKGQVL